MADFTIPILIIAQVNQGFNERDADVLERILLKIVSQSMYLR